MIAYHGSHLKGLKQLTYSEENSRFGGEDRLLHGAAIYLTVSEIEAKAYATSGSYYRVQIKGEIFDATDKDVLESFIKKFEKKHNIEDVLIKNKNIQSLIADTLSGKSSAVVFSTNIDRIIANDESLYWAIIGDFFNEDSDQCSQSLADLFSYKLIKLNNVSSDTWVLCLDQTGSCLEIIEEIEIT
jgi:hypothetical protein